jgi:hypothetical protein
MFLPENMELIDMNPLTEPYLIADAIENERQVPESKTNRYPGDFKITDMENIDKAKSYFDCTQKQLELNQAKIRSLKTYNVKLQKDNANYKAEIKKKHNFEEYVHELVKNQNI